MNIQKQYFINDKELISSKLLSWYDEEARVLPWRSDPKPYYVWVSEIMLQQTRVETALPYFQNFIHTLPNITALAIADEQKVNKLWEGLGYYSRVRNMQKAARIIVEQYNGELSSKPEELVKLPGIGEYTAGAIASIAFGMSVPAVDGNVLRVFSRLLASEADVDLPQTKREMKALVGGIVPKIRPGDFNQALMDLGATVCLPNTEPKCLECPLADLCEGYKQGIAKELPVKQPAKSRAIELLTVLVIVLGNKVLIHKRENKGLLAGLWEFPNIKGFFSQEEIQDYLSNFHIKPTSISEIGNAKHVFTHKEWHMSGFLIKTDENSMPEGTVWANSHELQTIYTLPSAFKTFHNVAESVINRA